MPDRPTSPESEWQDGAQACLPSGTFALASQLVERANRELRRLTATSLPVDRAWLWRQLRLPLEVEPDWPAPSLPIPVGAGAVHADLIEEDVATFARLREIEPTRDPERLASIAQSWRLPVTPYRTRVLAPVPSDLEGPVARRARLPRSPEEFGVVDLTALWAGPLATALLRAAGVRVTKVDPACRPDGFRARPALYRALNAGKHVIDLDLRRRADREQFERLLRQAHLVVDSFSRRVMPNLGYAPADLRRINPRLVSLSITAFPHRSAERDWVAFGAGVHAASGLGGVTGRPRPAPFAYPDALAGLRAFGVALELLGGGGEPSHREVSLLASLAPLMDGSCRD